MSVMDAREVLTHLNYLGYTNISAHQLKEFMIDLKRFIKYEDQCGRHDAKHAKHRQTYEQSVQSTGETENQERDVLASTARLHETETVASRAKKKIKSPKRQSNKHLITVEIHNPLQTTQTYRNIVPKLVIPQDTDDSTSRQSTQCHSCQCSQVVQHVPPNTISAVSVNTVNTIDTVDGQKMRPNTSKSLPILPMSGSGTTIGTKKTVRSKSARSSFIRPRVIKKPLKSDPVALYHQYKQEWDKIKFPGAHQHGETRWAVRERLLGDR